MPLALYALTVGAFGIGVTEFVIMGLLIDVGADLGVSIAAAGLLISGYALGVAAGAPLLAALTEALAVIHAEHCLHRDIAPDNVLLLADSGRPLPRIGGLQVHEIKGQDGLV